MMTTRMKKIHLLWCILFFLGCSEGLCLMDKEKMTGGPCHYREYQGTAVIMSVEKQGTAKDCSGISHELCEVKFSFFPRETIKESYVQVKGRKYELKLDNSSNPWQGFIEKYAIKVGRSFDCTLKVITRGTCTPLLFDFPSIDLKESLNKT